MPAIAAKIPVCCDQADGVCDLGRPYLISFQAWLPREPAHRIRTTMSSVDVEALEAASDRRGPTPQSRRDLHRGEALVHVEAPEIVTFDRDVPWVHATVRA